jgi:hypothetical protein
LYEEFKNNTGLSGSLGYNPANLVNSFVPSGLFPVPGEETQTAAPSADRKKRNPHPGYDFEINP